MRTRRLAAAVTAVAMLAAACGSDSDDQDQTDTSSTEQESAAAEESAVDDDGGEAASGDEVTLRWRTRPDNQASVDLYQSVSDRLDEQLDTIALEYEAGGSETSSYQDVLRTELSSGTAPDVFWIPGTDIADFASRGLLLDLRDLASASSEYAGDDAYYEGPMRFLTYDPETGNDGESLWGLPRDVSTFALYTNLDLIEQAGVPNPIELAENGEWTWEAFRQVTEAVNGLGDETYGYGMNGWWANYGYWIEGAGGSFFNEDRTACAVDTPEAIEGIEFMKGLYDDGIAVPYGEDVEPPFLAGQVGMFMNGRWATPGTRSSADFDWDVVKLPEGPGGPANWLFWGAYVVNADTENPEAAFRLLTELTSPETQLEIAELGANIPSRTDSGDTEEQFLSFTPPENNQAFLDGLQEDPATEGPLWNGDWPAFDGALGPAITEVIAGDQSIEDFQSSICGQLDATFSG